MDVTKRGRVLAFIALVVLVAELTSAPAPSLSGSKTVPETGTLTGEISLYYGGPRVIEVSHGRGTVVVEQKDRTIATQNVSRDRSQGSSSRRRLRHCELLQRGRLTGTSSLDVQNNRL
jgi:hypothetical protein